jgi:ABC-2 type transport system permease protein
VSTAAIEPVVSPLRSTVRCLLGLVERDLLILQGSWREFAVRAVVQPAMFLFVFTYVFPRIGHDFDAASGPLFKTIVVPGLAGYAAFYAGVYTIGMTLSLELSFGRPGLDDRLLAPMRTWLVGLEKAFFGGVQALFAGTLVVLIACVLPSTRPDFSLSAIPILAGGLIVVALTSAGAGMLVGTLVPPEKLASLFTIALIPVAFLGCIYYSWETLGAVRWLQILVLANPLTFVTETVRVMLTFDAPHLTSLAALGAGLLFGGALLGVGLRRFSSRVIG